MMIRLRVMTRDRRYRSAVAIVLVVLGLLVVWEHTGGEHGHHVGEIASVCLAVASGAVALLGLGGLPELRRRPLRFQVARPKASQPRPVPIPRSRAGPTQLQVVLR